VPFHEDTAEIPEGGFLVPSVKEKPVKFSHARHGPYCRTEVFGNAAVGFPVKLDIKACFFKFLLKTGVRLQGIPKGGCGLDGVLKGFPGQDISLDAPVDPPADPFPGLIRPLPVTEEKDGDRPADRLEGGNRFFKVRIAGDFEKKSLKRSFHEERSELIQRSGGCQGEGGRVGSFLKGRIERERFVCGVVQEKIAQDGLAPDSGRKRGFLKCKSRRAGCEQENNRL
jgi:hypothetical protein